MQAFKLVGVIERNVVDTYNIELTAEDAEEAQDLAYEVLSNLPYTDLVVEKLLRVNTQPERAHSIALEFQREELNEDQETAEEVFFDGDDDDGPKRA
jgi:hypothetical protein